MPDETTERFRTHKKYIEALSMVGGKGLTTGNKSALQRLAQRATASGTLTDQRPASINRPQVEKSLRNAWSTEVLLALPGEWAEEDEFIRLSNSWGVVQAYYVAYHMTQALIVAKGNARPTTHPKTQTQYANLWVDRPLDFPPWTFGVAESGWKNLSGNAAINPVHPWETCNRDTCWSLAAVSMRTTREPAVRSAKSSKRDEGQRQRKRAWEAEENRRIAAGRRARTMPSFPRPRLTAVESQACEAKVRTYTILDYFYRLRVGANYDDAGVFVDGPENDVDSYLLHKRVNFLASGLALLSELRIRDLVSPRVFDGWANAFANTSIPPSYDVGIKERLRFY